MLKPLEAPANWRRLLPHRIAMEFPDIDAETFQDLMASIKRDGFDPDHPIVLFDGKILDGRNRFRAMTLAKGLNAAPVFKEFSGTFEEAVEFSMKENFRRRHLTAGQRALIADSLANLPNGGDRKSDQTANLQTDPESDNMTIERASCRANVAPRTTHHARELRRMDPAAAHRVKEGKESLNGALTKARKAEREAIAETAEPEAPPIQDTAGRAIPERVLAPLTDGRERFTNCINLARRLGRDIKEICVTPDGRLLEWAAVKTDLDNVLRMLRYCAPFTSCPLGDPCDDDCRLCKGTGWIGESQWENVPAEFKGNGRKGSK